MEKENVQVVRRGLSFSSVLTLIFITLKLLGVITWSWFFVLLPTILAVGFSILFCISIVILLIVFNR